MAVKRVLSKIGDPPIPRAPGFAASPLPLEPPVPMTAANSVNPTVYAPIGNRATTLGDAASPYRHYLDAQSEYVQATSEPYKPEPYITNSMPYPTMMMPSFEDTGPSVQESLRWLPLMNLLGGSQAGPAILGGYAEGMNQGANQRYVLQSKQADYRNDFTTGRYDAEQTRVNAENKGIDARNTIGRQVYQTQSDAKKGVLNIAEKELATQRTGAQQQVRALLRSLTSGGILNPQVALSTMQQIDQLNKHVSDNLGGPVLKDIVPADNIEGAGLAFYNKMKGIELQNKGRVDAATMYGLLANEGRKIAGEYGLKDIEARGKIQFRLQKLSLASQEGTARANRVAQAALASLNAGLQRQLTDWRLSSAEWAKQSELAAEAAKNGKTQQFNEFQRTATTLASQQRRSEALMASLQKFQAADANGGFLYHPDPIAESQFNQDANELQRVNDDITKLSNKLKLLATDVKKPSSVEEPNPNPPPKRTGSDAGGRAVGATPPPARYPGTQGRSPKVQEIPRRPPKNNPAPAAKSPRGNKPTAAEVMGI